MTPEGHTFICTTWGRVPITVGIKYGPCGDWGWQWEIEEIRLDIPDYDDVEIQHDLEGFVIERIRAKINDDVDYLVAQKRREGKDE